MKKVLLLGGNGYIGSKFYELYKNKYDITSIDLCMFNADLGYSLKVNYVDYIKNSFNVFDVIICLAGHSSVGMSEFNPNNAWINNVEYFRNLCGKLNQHQRLIYASSASVYGNSARGVSTEKTEINFNVLNHYDLQKITLDLIANKYVNSGKHIIGLRFGTVNGFSKNTRSDLMINSMVKSAAETGTVNVKNAHIRRAILGINDLVNALDIILQNDINPGQYNLSSFNSTVGNIAQTIVDKTNAKLVTHSNDTIVYDFELSTEKFQTQTGFVFKDTIDNLVPQLILNMDVINFDNRNDDRNIKL